ncbi:hypothetical protein LCGC14_1919510 [marine sediment metagenome]|uniref:Uncharacterized protein n=2 Tax=root TaxID=1 RepID=A0A831QRC2_9FLAO|nr:hypothetical protein [Pricia antarctica]
MNAAKSGTMMVPTPTIHYFEKNQNFEPPSVYEECELSNGSPFYDLTELSNGNTQLGERINIRVSKGFNRFSPDHWIHIHPFELCGYYIRLARTHGSYIYIGYVGKNLRREHVILLEYTVDFRVATILYCQHFYTPDYRVLLPHINNEHLKQKRV